MESEKVTQLVLKLIKLTQNKEIIWKHYTVNNRDLPTGEFLVDKLYETEVGLRRFQLYRYMYKQWLDEENFVSVPRIRLELVDVGGETDYEFEYENSMNDLYDFVREQSSNVSEVVDDILGIRLKIIEAVYGTAKKYVIVTEELKKRIVDNKLRILAGNDLAGDPDEGNPKKLRIIYEYADKRFEREFKEGHIINLP